MGLLKLIQYKKHRRERKELKADMLAMALQESVTCSMKDRRYLDAMRLIKEIWQLKTNPWAYSTSIVNYIECLIRKKRFREINLLEKELVRFYISVLSVSPRCLMSFAHDLMMISSSSRALHAALLSFYSALVAQTELTSELAMKFAGESINFMKNVMDCLKEESDVREYLLVLMKELRDYLNATQTKKKKKLKSQYLEHCEKLINETKSEMVKLGLARTELETGKRRKHEKLEGRRKCDLQSRRTQSLGGFANSPGKCRKKRLLGMSTPVPDVQDFSTARQRVYSDNQSKYMDKLRRPCESPSAPKVATQLGAHQEKERPSNRRKETIRKKKLSSASVSDAESGLPSEHGADRRFARNQQSIHRPQKTYSCSSYICEVRTVSTASASPTSSIPSTPSGHGPAIPDSHRISDVIDPCQSGSKPHPSLHGVIPSPSYCE